MQSLSKTYIATLQAHGVKISVAHRCRPWENGYAERLIRTLKAEEVHLNEYQDIHEARKRIGTCYDAGVQSETPTFGVRVFDTSGISTTNLLLTLRNCGLNKRMHYTRYHIITRLMGISRKDREYIEKHAIDKKWLDR